VHARICTRAWQLKYKKHHSEQRKSLWALDRPTGARSVVWNFLIVTLGHSVLDSIMECPPPIPPPGFISEEFRGFLYECFERDMERRKYSSSLFLPKLSYCSFDDYHVLISRHFFRYAPAMLEHPWLQVSSFTSNETTLQTPYTFLFAARGRIRPKFIAAVSRSAAVNLIQGTVTCDLFQQRSAAVEAGGAFTPQVNPAESLRCSLQLDSSAAIAS
jgi:hypothetical protein